MAGDSVFSNREEEFGRKLDRCVTDAIMKGSGGLLVGSIISLIVFKRKAWPLIMGTGFGIGNAFKSCERDLNSFK